MNGPIGKRSLIFAYLRRISPEKVLSPLIVLLLLFACEEEKVNKPVVQTLAVGELRDDGVTFNARVSIIGDFPASGYGFVFSTRSSPGIKDSVYDVGNRPEEGVFSKRVSDDLTTDETYYVRAFIRSAKGDVLFGNVVSFKSMGSASPVIDDFEPKNGYAGASVTITGEHFSATQGKVTVHIGETKCNLVSASRNKIVVKIPGSYVMGSYPIKVTVADRSATSEDHFKLEGASIESFSPQRGPAGTVVTIKGKGFVPQAEVFFDDKKATVQEVTETQLKVVVPIISSAGAKPLSLKINGVTSTTSETFSLTGPEIYSFSPTAGIQGTKVTIRGSGFSPILVENRVTIGNRYSYSQPLSATETELVVAVPIPFAAGKFSVTVEVKSIRAVSTEQFTIEGPEITGVTPGAQYGGRTITITGKNFYPDGGNVVTFGYRSGSVLSHSSTSLTVVVPMELQEDCQLGVRVGELTGYAPADFKLLSPWQKGNNFPGGKRYGAVSFTVGDYAYVGMGITTTGDRKDLWRYDAAARSWTRMADLPASSRAYSFSFTINGKAYVGAGGHYGSSSYNLINSLYDLWEYDPATNQWTEKQSLSSSGYKGERNSGMAIGNTGYVVSGKTVLKYDPLADQWSSSNSFPGALSSGRVAVTIGGKGYYGVAWNSGELWEFDPTSQTWTQMPDARNPNYWDVTYFAINNRLYVGNSNHFQEFDPATRQWKVFPNVPVTANSTAPFTIGNIGYFATGLDGYGYDLFYRFDPNY